MSRTDRTNSVKAAILRSLLLFALLGFAAACGDDEEPGGSTPDCTAGATGCTCATGDTCSDASDECNAGMCRPRTDCTGEIGCACNAGACNDGLSCSNNLCLAPNSLVVQITGGDSRACDILVQTAGRQVTDVVFPAGVRGRHTARNELAALALIRTSDTALSGVSATLVFDGDEAVEASVVTSVNSQCYGRLGGIDTAVTATAE